MNKSIISILLLFLFLGSTIILCAQNAQVKIEEQLDKDRKQKVHEKLFAHTDKNFYLSGEIVWFKLYYVDGSLHKPLDLSKLAYVEVLDKDLKPVLQAKVPLSQGSGNGSFYLPVSLNSGVYRFRAYTQWMKNFSADYFFEEPLTIVNSTKSLETQPQQNTAYDIGFFPEGGNLVRNLQTKVAFRIADASGKGISCKGIVVNQNNDTVAVFQPFKFGIGHFIFTPKDRDIYKAMIMIGDTTVFAELPVVREQGYVMNVSKEGEAKLRVRVTANTQTADAIHLVIHTRQILKLSEQKSLVSGAADFMIDKSNLGEGISHLTIFNGAKKPLCERLYFVRPTKQLHIESGAAAQQFSSRSKVSMEVVSGDETGKPVPADLSVSVYRLGAASAFEGIDITSYLWLTSDLRGNIESPGFYFSDKSAGAEEAADNLMLTHGWRRFIWQDIVSNINHPMEFVPEFREHIINAKITDTKTGLPAPDILTYLSVPGKRVQLYTSKSDSAGRLKFYTNDFYGQNEILVQTDSRGDTSHRIEIINPFSDRFSSTSLSAFKLPENMKDLLTDQSVSVQVQNIFSGEKLKQLYHPAIDSNAFYGLPDNSYMLDDYVRFSTMEEVLREYVTEVLVRRQKEDFRLIMSGGLENKVFLDDPITLFNGVPVFETNKIIQYDPLKVQKIEVVKRRYFYGPALLNGIVNFTTYQPDPAMLSGLNAVVFDYEGLQFAREFYSPVYETQEQLTNRLPDFRDVLYWSHNVKTTLQGKSQINFYTSDLKGRYMVVLQGMDADGKTGRNFFTFDVK
jgi:hypothetical protein